MRATPRLPGRILASIAVGATAALALASCGTSHVRAPALPTATRLGVTVATDRTAYRADQAIGVTVANGTASTFYAHADHSACTVVQLQRLDAGTWHDEMPCTTKQAPILPLTAYSSQPFTLAPGNSPNDRNLWVPGTYRLTLAIGVQSNGTDDSLHVYSAGFQITAA